MSLVILTTDNTNEAEQAVWMFFFFLQIVQAVITVDPVVKYSLAHKGMQTRL